MEIEDLAQTSLSEIQNYIHFPSRYDFPDLEDDVKTYLYFTGKNLELGLVSNPGEIRRMIKFSDILTFGGEFENVIIPSCLMLVKGTEIRNCCFDSCSDAMYVCVWDRMMDHDCFRNTIFTRFDKPTWKEISKTLTTMQPLFREKFFEIVKSVFESHVVKTTNVFHVHGPQIPHLKQDFTNEPVVEKLLEEHNIKHDGLIEFI